MKKNKIIAVLAAGTILGSFGAETVSVPNVAHAEAVTGAGGFSDVPLDHWSYEALDYLAKEGIIEGYGDGTFRGSRTMSRYEMAAIVARASKNGSLGGEAVLEKLQREFKDELQTMKKQVKQNTEDIQALKKEQERVQLHGFVRAQYENRNDHAGTPVWENERTNNRFFLNLQADLKVNQNWKGHFQIEANNRWRQNNSKTSDDYGHTRSHDKNANKDWGTIQRVWLTGDYPNGLQIDAGRHWTFLGNHFTMLGAETTGIDVSYPVTKNGLRVGAFWKQLSEYDNADFSFYGARVNGPIGHNFDISLAYAHVGDGSDPDGKAAPYSDVAPGNLVYGGNWTGKNAFLVGFGTNVAKNLRLSADYVRTDWSPGDNPALDGQDVSRGHRNQSFRVMLDYKWTNPSVVGSFGAFAGYHYLGANGSIFPDENDGAIKRNSRGWQVGFRYVPWKNVVWETKYVRSIERMLPEWNGDNSYHRNLLRTQFDFIF